ncbi:MAG TPA: chromosome segregation protein SMC, partial [Sutterella sp.]|nr:chromosome segregation protein SMC [Sutterella sp.]
KSRSEKVKNDIESLSRRASEVEKNRAEAEERFASLDESLSELQQAELTAQQSLEKAQRESEAMQSRIRDLKEQANLSRVKERDAIEHKAETEKSAESAREETLLMTEEREALAEELAQLNATAQVEGLASFIAERDRTKTEEIAAQEMSDTAENALEAARSEQRSILDGQMPRQQAIADLQVKRQAWVTQTQTFTAAIDASGEDRTELARIVVREKLKAGTLKNRVAKLVEEIAALGPVNHAALENLEASRKAMAETARQVEDLNEAIENLEATIRKIDAETRTLLKNTFETVSSNFTQMFKDLFGGGTASLTMTGEEILDCGVEVRAQPPGKRNASVKLLSGGEQALTATALVFAIFSLNPAPFCLLDEVDAPLDEANQDRLARQIIAMSGSTQFMMITHHRVTMEYLKRLVGVTMKEPGVSRVVAVDVAEGSRLAAS